MLFKLRKLCRMLLRRCRRWTWRCFDFAYQQMATKINRMMANIKADIMLIANISALHDRGSMTTWNEIQIFYKRMLIKLGLVLTLGSISQMKPISLEQSSIVTSVKAKLLQRSMWLKSCSQTFSGYLQRRKYRFEFL